MINFKAITEDNFDQIIQMKRPEGETFVAANVYSLAQAWLFRKADDVYPFAIYDDDNLVGFMMLDEDLEERCLVIWRILIAEENMGNGYGTGAMRQIIELARESGKYDFMILDCSRKNRRAWHVYEKIGFYDTGETENDECIMRLDF